MPSPKLKVLTLVFVTLTFCVTAHAQQVIGGSGKQYMQAVTPEGQYISLVYEAKGQTVFCGIHVAWLAFEFRLDGTGSDARQIAYVHELKPANSKVEYLYEEKDGGKQISGTTTFRDLDYSTGKIIFTIAGMPFAEPNSRFKAVLTSPFKGTLSRETKAGGK